MREWEIGAVENIGALPYIRFAPILALVGVGVNRIGKLRSSLRRKQLQDDYGYEPDYSIRTMLYGICRCDVHTDAIAAARC